MRSYSFFVRATRLMSTTAHAGAALPPTLPGLTPSQLYRIETRDKALREKHIAIEGSLTEDLRDEVRRKRMIYRSKQRGWLEVDLLLGSFASIYIPTMTVAELDEYEEILKEETIDTFNFITGKDIVPDYLANNSIMKRLQVYAKNNEIQSPESYAAIKEKTNLI